MTVCSARRWARSSAGSSSGRSERSAVVQLGSSPTTSAPAASSGANRSRLRPATRRATPSWPVEIQVSPQQTRPDGIVTSKPADSSTSTAARPTSGVR